jgi:hypothetical protein
MLRPAILVVSLAATLLAGCDMLGIESPEKVALAREAEGKAVGAACRHAGRAIEDCYTLNRRTDKASIFAGWRDMNDYMRENKIEAVPPVLVAQVAKPAAESKSVDSKPADAKIEPKADPKADKPVVEPKPKDAKDPKAAHTS